jgi:hypothetical protein
MGGFANIIKHFTDMIGSNDESAAPIESFEDLVAKFKLPDIIINGRIAKLVKEIFGSFSLEEFGLTPEILSNQEKTLEHLKYLLESQPEIIKKSIDKLIATVKFKLENGSIKKDDLIDELKSIVAELAANEELKKVFGNHSAILSTVLDSLTSQKSEPSERCKEVRERLKKKAEAKKATKTTTSLIVSPAAEAKAAAAMAALLKEELNTPIKSKRK